MTRKGILLLLSTLLLPCFFRLPVAHAQSPGGIVVIYPAAEKRADGVELNVFFTITDDTGAPLSATDSVESATIQLLGGDDQPVPATVGDPKTAFYVALLLDTSGSMKNVIGAVREAAMSAIDNAPPTANFAVIPFSKVDPDQDLRPVVDFTDDHDLVKSIIAEVGAKTEGSTCLYNATYKAIDLLAARVRQPQERRAIILFTDGKDELGNGQPCSLYKYDAVIDKALPHDAPNTPIYTIGLCEDTQCKNLNPFELRNMAKDTYAFSAIGQQNELRDAFQEIMNGLSSQRVARANVYARRGVNQAVLSVKLRDVETPLTAAFSFYSDTDFKKPAEPVGIQIANLTYDPKKDVYSLSVSIANSTSAQRIVVQVWDKKNGTQVLPEQTFDPATTLQIERGTGGLKAGREYTFQVKAVDAQGTLISNGEGQTVLAEKEFMHDPEPVTFDIQSVKVEGETLLVDLDAPEDTSVIKYDGLITSKDTGQTVHSFGPDLFRSRRLEVALPPAILQAGGPRSYVLTVYLTTKDDQRLESKLFEFTYEPPGFGERVGQFVTSPVALGGVFVLTCAVAVGLIIQSRRRRTRGVIPGPRDDVPGLPPPVESTREDILDGEPPLRLQLTVVQTPAPGGGLITDRQEVVEITRFPFTIGRAAECDLRFPDDLCVSRFHLKILADGDKFALEDQESTYGTKLDGQDLAPRNRLQGLTGPVTMRLGKRTIIKIERRLY